LDHGYLNLKIILDRRINDYEVKVYQFLDLTGQLGGIFEIAEVICKFFVAILAQRLFYYHVINNVHKSTGEIIDEDSQNRDDPENPQMYSLK
jgi:hypothetical protein